VGGKKSRHDSVKKGERVIDLTLGKMGGHKSFLEREKSGLTVKKGRGEKTPGERGVVQLEEGNKVGRRKDYELLVVTGERKGIILSHLRFFGGKKTRTGKRGRRMQNSCQDAAGGEKEKVHRKSI